MPKKYRRQSGGMAQVSSTLVFAKAHAGRTGVSHLLQAAGARTASRKATKEGEVHRAPPPHQHRVSPVGVLRAQTRCRPGVDGMMWRTKAYLLANHEISRFPFKERPHMPRSATTPGRSGTRVSVPFRLAFHSVKSVGARNEVIFAAR